LKNLEKNEKLQLFAKGKTIMNTLVNSINDSVSKAVSNYTKKIAKNFNLDEDELMELWNNLEVSSKAKPEGSKAKPEGSKAKPEGSKAKSTDEEKVKSARPDSSGSSCPYIYKKGVKQNQACGNKSRTGFVYCSAHKKHEGEDPKPGKVLPNPLKRVSKKSSDAPPANVPKVIRTNKQLNVVWNPDTRMVFRSIHDRVVHARIVDGAVTPLTEEDREVCKKWGFQYAEEETEPVSNENSVEDDFKHSRSMLKKAIGIEDDSSDSGLTSEEE
jgi:hypothetical protein